MKLRARTDKNQANIVATLREIGCSVQSLHKAGEGVPDLLVGFQGQNWLMEVKREIVRGKVMPSASKLNDKQVEWHDTWRGQVDVVRTADEALRLIGIKI
jgi:hypothetical protein